MLFAPVVLIVPLGVPKSAIDLLGTKCRVIECTSYNVNEDEILEKVMGVNGILWPKGYPISRKILDKAGQDLKVVSLPAKTVCNLNVEDLRSRHIKIGIVSTIYIDSVADHAIGLMINCCRRIFEYNRIIKLGRWNEMVVDRMFGKDINGSTVGFVGFGDVAQAIARRLMGFDIANIIYYCRTKKIIPEFDKPVAMVNFYEILKHSDILFLCCPLTFQTENLINEDAFRNMKSNCVLINVCSGKLIDEQALQVALEEKQIFAAGLDCFAKAPLEGNHPLLKLDNCVITPNIALATNRTQIDMYLIAAHNILRAIANEQMYEEYV